MEQFVDKMEQKESKTGFITKYVCHNCFSSTEVGEINFAFENKQVLRCGICYRNSCPNCGFIKKCDEKCNWIICQTCRDANIHTCTFSIKKQEMTFKCNYCMVNKTCTEDQIRTCDCGERYCQKHDTPYCGYCR